MFKSSCAHVFIFTDDLTVIGFRHLEEGEHPVPVTLGSDLPLRLSWGEAVSLVPTVSLSGNPKALPGSPSVNAE